MAGATLHYRHVDQSESFRTAVMQGSGDEGLLGTIDADYTASPYTLVYFFDVEHRIRRARYRAGADLSNQPYFTLGSAGEAH